MVNLKSHNSAFDVELLLALLDDLVSSNGINNTRRDKATVVRRHTSEGFSFLSKTLPKLGAAIDSALRTGKFICPSNFRRYKNTALPVFLRGLLRNIFDDAGELADDIDFSSITEVRQVCFLFYKVKTEFSDRDIEVAEKKYVEIDRDLPSLKLSALSTLTQWVISYGQDFINELFMDFDPRDIIPSHGPGIVASGEKPHEKRHFKVHYKEIHNVYPYYRFFYVNPIHLLHTREYYFARVRADSGINKVMFVPKDSRGPRTIAAEPLEYQWLQQGLRKKMYAHIEHHKLTRGRVNFTDQTVNQRLAQEASLPYSTLCTVDMSDASDRVSVDLVKLLFDRKEELLRCLLALRTPVSLLPSGKKVTLKKYASMGSALCFPVEAIVFYALIYGYACVVGDSKPNIYVYGDDIILKTEMFSVIDRIFSELGLMINKSKSSTTGFFRESCGKEYFCGSEITYVKLRRRKITGPDDLASFVETSNLLWDRCYYKAAMSIQKFLEKEVSVSIPFGYSDSSYICYYSNRGKPTRLDKTRWNKNLQRFEVLRPHIVGGRYRASDDTCADSYAELLRKVTQGWSPEFRSGCYAQRHSQKIKFKYVHAYM
jgi:hypothetical protein